MPLGKQNMLANSTVCKSAGEEEKERERKRRVQFANLNNHHYGYKCILCTEGHIIFRRRTIKQEIRKGILKAAPFYRIAVSGFFFSHGSPITKANHAVDK